MLREKPPLQPLRIGEKSPLCCLCSSSFTFGSVGETSRGRQAPEMQVSFVQMPSTDLIFTRICPDDHKLDKNFATKKTEISVTAEFVSKTK